MRTLTIALLVGLAAELGCGGTGLGSAVRTDITQQMNSAQPSISQCYEDALQRSRKLQGTMVVSFNVTAKTGKFENAQVNNNQLSDPALEQCVVAEVEKLSLSTPQKTVVGVDSYPIEFTPIDTE